jgi:hypothetical protein
MFSAAAESTVKSSSQDSSQSRKVARRPFAGSVFYIPRAARGGCELDGPEACVAAVRGAGKSEDYSCTENRCRSMHGDHEV